MTHQNDPVAHAHQKAREWLNVIGGQLGTEDHPYVYRVTRTWLHVVRDRLTVDSAVHLAAQLPEFLRGVFYDGWTPSRVPVRYNAEKFTRLFAREAGISPSDVSGVAGAVSAGLNALFSPGQLDHVFALMPAGLRGEIEGEGAVTAQAPAPRRTGENVRIGELEAAVLALTQAVAALVRGMEELPTREPVSDRAAKAAQEAHRILMSQEAVRT